MQALNTLPSRAAPPRVRECTSHSRLTSSHACPSSLRHFPPSLSHHSLASSFCSSWAVAQPLRSRGLLSRAQAQHHPDFPSAQAEARYRGLCDQDVLELEEFLRMFQQRGMPDEEAEGPGEVHLVGTGPGDPGLLTLRAVQLMQTADVVLYDRLVSDDILRLVGPHARMVYVGKHSGFHTRSQEEIHKLLLAFAEAGARVIRLKGGDPYVFGRGGEEVAYLSAKGIHVQCVPGITAASGICAELGIPMTHRGVATSVRFLTGHARDGGEQELLDSTVTGAADPHTTLVVYMGLQSLPNLYTQLHAHGMPPNVPAVAVERGTTRRQRTVWGEVAQLPQRAQEAALKSPALIIIGQVVSLAPGWQQWDAAGRPLLWQEGQLPSHRYALPLVDSEQLQAASHGLEGKLATATTSSPSSSSSSSSSSSGSGSGSGSRVAGSSGASTSALSSSSSSSSGGSTHLRHSSSVAAANAGVSSVVLASGGVSAMGKSRGFSRGSRASVRVRASSDHSGLYPASPAASPSPSPPPGAPGCGDEELACELPNLPPLTTSSTEPAAAPATTSSSAYSSSSSSSSSRSSDSTHASPSTESPSPSPRPAAQPVCNEDACELPF